MAERLLVWTVIGLEGAFALAVALVLGHGVWLRVYHAWAEPRLAAGRLALSELVNAPEGASDARLRAMPPGLRMRVFVELARVLTGSAKTRLRGAAERLGLVRRAVRDTGSRFWRTRLRGARILTRLGGSARVMLPLFHDRSAAVRIQAAEWAAEEGSPEAALALVALLADGDPLCRNAVQDSLVRLGGAGVPALADFLATDDPAAAARALRVAAAVPHQGFLAPAVRLSESPDAQVRALAVAVLAALGGEEATASVGSHLDDPHPAVRAAAAEAVARLGWWAAAPRLAPLLRDPAWTVRRAAGLALWQLGSPGILQLRRLRGDGDRFAADMARQVLDLGEVAER